MNLKIVVFGEKYSDNLGDGVISECLEFAFNKVNLLNGVEVEVTTHDLSMRDNYKLGVSERDDNKSSLVSVYYRRIKKLVGWELFRSKSFHQKYKYVVKDSDLVVIGGGQIFLDNELNFPVKLRALTKILDKYHINRAFVCCGVSSKMSIIGRYIFRQLVNKPSVLGLIVRDMNSITNAKSVLSYPSPYFLTDPAIISSDLYSKNTSLFKDFQGVTIGVNVMDFITLEKCYKNEISRDVILDVWVKFINKLLNSGYRVVLHTNGSAEDNNSLQILSERLDLNKNILIMMPKNPSELATIISNLDALVAYRLHANILAYSLSVPSVGVVWDDKVSEFASITERSNFFIGKNQINSDYFYEVLQNALSSPIDQNKLNELKLNFYNGISLFLSNSNK